MDRISIAGLVLALGAIIGGLMLEGGHPASLLQVTAFLVVVGGTTGAVMLQSSAEQFSDAMRLGLWVFKPPVHEPKRLIARVSGWSQTARRGGLLALETAIDVSREPFERKGLQLLVDGAEPDVLREALELEINAFEARHRAAARVWEAAGGYAPTVGILGAVMGLHGDAHGTDGPVPSARGHGGMDPGIGQNLDAPIQQRDEDQDAVGIGGLGNAAGHELAQGGLMDAAIAQARRRHGAPHGGQADGQPDQKEHSTLSHSIGPERQAHGIIKAAGVTSDPAIV